MKKLSFLLAVLLVFTVVLASCGKEESGGLVIDKNNNADTSTTHSIKGLDGTAVEISKTITKIASLDPGMTCILLGLGASGKIVAIDSDSSSFDGASSLNVTDASGAAALTPEVAFVTDGADASALTSAGITVFVIPMATSVSDIKEMIRLAGNVTGTSTAAETLVDSMNKAIEVSRNASMGEAKKNVFIDLGNFYTVGTGTYLTEAVTAAGATSVFADQTGFFTVTEEDVIAANPDFIFTVGSADDYSGDAWAGVNAVVNGFIYTIDANAAKYATQNLGSVTSTIFSSISDSKAS